MLPQADWQTDSDAAQAALDTTRDERIAFHTAATVKEMFCFFVVVSRVHVSSDYLWIYIIFVYLTDF